MNDNKISKLKKRPVLIIFNLITLFISITILLFIPLYQIYNIYFNSLLTGYFQVIAGIISQGFPDPEKFGNPFYISFRILGSLILQIVIFLLGISVWYKLIRYILNKNRKNFFDYNLARLENPIINLEPILFYFITYFGLLIFLMIIADNF